MTPTFRIFRNLCQKWCGQVLIEDHSTRKSKAGKAYHSVICRVLAEICTFGMPKMPKYWQKIISWAKAEELQSPNSDLKTLEKANKYQAVAHMTLAQKGNAAASHRMSPIETRQSIGIWASASPFALVSGSALASRRCEQCTFSASNKIYFY